MPCISKPSQLSMFCCSSSWPLKVLQTVVHPLDNVAVNKLTLSVSQCWPPTAHPSHLNSSRRVGGSQLSSVESTGLLELAAGPPVRPPLLHLGLVPGQGASCGSQKTVTLCPVPGSTCHRKMRIWVSHVMDCPLERSTMKGMSKCAASKKTWIPSIWNVAGAAEELNSSFHFMLFCFTLIRHVCC